MESPDRIEALELVRGNPLGFSTDFFETTESRFDCLPTDFLSLLLTLLLDF